MESPVDGPLKCDRILGAGRWYADGGDMPLSRDQLFDVLRVEVEVWLAGGV